MSESRADFVSGNTMTTGKLPKPKPKSYLILYADGRAKAVNTLPPDIVNAAQAKSKATPGE